MISLIHLTANIYFLFNIHSILEIHWLNLFVLNPIRIIQIVTERSPRIQPKGGKRKMEQVRPLLIVLLRICLVASMKGQIYLIVSFQLVLPSIAKVKVPPIPLAQMRRRKTNQNLQAKKKETPSK